MRIPIFLIDLNRKHGFKRLAKWVFKRLPAGTSISLTQMHEILAISFGYQGFYELQKTAQNTPPVHLRNRAVPEMNLAKQFISKTLLLRLGNEVDERTLEEVVQGLPLNVLAAYRSDLRPQPSNHIGPKQTSSQRVAMSPEQIQAIVKVVYSSGDLRDQALLACMLTGVRALEYLSARFGQSISSPPRHIDSGRNPLATIPHSCQLIIEKYATAQGLVEGDFLFPSRRNSQLPMSPHSLQRLCAQWAREAGLEEGSFSPRRVRISTAAYKDYLAMGPSREGTSSSAKL
ncbi:hypothetical protein QTN23_09705 [Pseudomonas shirazica]|uniref:hypothetical protein n=1 Tax=Pseudomonas shirazica TaxID=1940636 RepID=UPI0025A94312|nr:hypothetical protein [Pseudomonas shirazica]MDM9599759.1 hypothetical protein [Pseudomonas shirazica]MDO2413187.1 hypothetical protein [Pseudomonas shirazica]